MEWMVLGIVLTGISSLTLLSALWLMGKLNKENQEQIRWLVEHIENRAEVKGHAKTS